MRSILIAFCLVCFSTGALIAQQDFALQFMPGLLQGQITNPAFTPDRNVVISLPGIQNTLFFTGPTYDDIFGKNQDGKQVVDVEGFLNGLDEVNDLREQLNVYTLGGAVRLGPLVLSLGHQVHFDAFLSYPETLPKLIWEGNGNYIGETMDLSSDFEIYSYNEFALGTAFEFENFSIGGRFKYLAGLGDISTERGDATLFTDEEIYALDFNADYLINTSSVLEYDAFNEIDLNFSAIDVDLGRTFSKNNGFAFDLGATGKIGPVRLSASVLDIGRINWSENVRNYSAQGNFNYDGLDLSQALTDDSVSFEAALDTLSSIFSVVETFNNYATELPTRMYISASIEPSEQFTFGAMYYQEWYRDETNPAVALSAQYRPWDWLQVGATYAIVQDTYANIGLNGLARLGPVQVFAATDNFFSAFVPGRTRYFSFRAGANLVFGKVEADESGL
jgi:hypothetical protein